MNEKLIVKNFGAIKSAEIEVKDINIFIGHTASGKSTLAKLIAIFKNIEFIQANSLSTFKKMLGDYNIDFEFKRETLIRYESESFYWEAKNEEIETNYPFSPFFQSFNLLASPPPNKENLLELGVYMLANQIFTLSTANDLISELKLKDKANKYTSLIEDFFSQNKKITNSKESIQVKYNSLQKSIIDIYNEINQAYQVFNIQYIPAERILIAMVGESLFGLMSKDIALAKSFKDFGAKFETARKEMKDFDINFLKVKYLHEQGSNFLVLENKTKIKLENAASGLQSIVPLLLVVTHATEQDSIIRNCIVVEEPELNLYPSIQKELIEFLIEKTQKVGDKLIITTHSPYVLTTIDNLIQANNVVQLHKEQKKEVSNIIPSKLWVDFDKVSCYFVANGTARKTLNEEFRTIGASNIDDVSIELGKTFDELMDLKYQEYAS